MRIPVPPHSMHVLMDISFLQSRCKSFDIARALRAGSHQRPLPAPVTPSLYRDKFRSIHKHPPRDLVGGAVSVAARKREVDCVGGNEGEPHPSGAIRIRFAARETFEP